MPSMHLICRRGLNVKPIKHPLYESGVWDIPAEDAARLVGGVLYLHETKSKRSYFGGRIESFRTVQTDHAHPLRIVFSLTSLLEAKEVKWRGANHDMAWTSGVLEDAS